MNRELFEDKMNKEIPDYSNREFVDIIHDSLSSLTINEKGTKNLVIVMEELMEAGIEVAKYLRGERNDTLGLIEEIADVCIAIKYTQEICNISDEILQKAINIKLERQKERNLKGGSERNV